MTPAGANKSTAAPEGDPAPNLRADIDTLLEGIDGAADRVQEAAAPAAAIPSDEHPAQPGADALQAIDNLDAQLAELTAELLEPNKSASPVPKAPPTDSEHDHGFEPEVVEAEAVAPIPPPEARPAHKPVVQPAPQSVAPTPATAPAVTADESAALNAPVATSPKQPSPVFRFFEALSRPLLAKPPHVRTIAALFAIQTALIAGGLWAYLLLRPPPAPSHGPAFNLSSDTLPRPVEPKADEPPSAPHGSESKDSHAKPKAEPKPDKKAGKSAKPAAEHH